MRKILIGLLLIISFNGFGQTLNTNSYEWTKLQWFDKFVWFKDSARVKSTHYDRLTSYPCTNCKGTVINYKDTFKVNNGGSTWIILGGSPLTSGSGITITSNSVNLGGITNIETTALNPNHTSNAEINIGTVKAYSAINAQAGQIDLTGADSLGDKAFAFRVDRIKASLSSGQDSSTILFDIASNIQGGITGKSDDLYFWNNLGTYKSLTDLVNGSSLPIVGDNQTNAIKLSTNTTHNNSGLIDIYNDSSLNLLNASNISDGNAININNTDVGTGINIINNALGTGIYLRNNDANNGQYVFNAGIGNGEYVYNESTGQGIDVANVSTGTALHINNSNSGKGLFINNTSDGPPLIINQTNEDNHGVLKVDTSGNIFFHHHLTDTVASQAYARSLIAGLGGGTVTIVSVTTANGVSGSVANANTTPAITLTLGAITPTTVNGNTITTGTGTLTMAASKVLTANNTLTLSGTDGSTLNIGGGGTLGSNAYTSTAYAPLASPTFTGTVTIPTPFTLGATSVTSTGAQLNYLNAATGTTGTTSTNLVFSTSPTLVTPVLGVATATSIDVPTITSGSTSSTGGLITLNQGMGSEMFTSFLRTNWTLTSGWDATNGSDVNINHNANGLTTATLNTVAAVVGTSYYITIVVSALTAGTGSYTFGAATSQTFSAAGTYTDCLTATTTGGLVFTPSNTARFTINSITIKANSNGIQTITGLNGGAFINGLQLYNNTAATANTLKQNSPFLEFSNHVWQSTGSVDLPSKFRIGAVGTNGTSSTAVNQFTLLSESYNSGAYTDLLYHQHTAAGQLTLTYSGNGGGIFTNKLQVGAATLPVLNMTSTATNSTEQISFNENSGTEKIRISHFQSAHATTAQRNGLDINLLASGPLRILTNSTLRNLTLGTGEFEIIGTNPIHIGGAAGTGSDFTHAITGGGVSLFIEPKTDDALAVVIRKAGAGVAVQSWNTSTPGTTITGTLSISGHVTTEGVTSTGATGTGKFVFDNTPTLVTPVLGVASATTINKVTITAPATSATLTIADGSSLITSGANSLTLTTTGTTNVTLPTSGTLLTTASANRQLWYSNSDASTSGTGETDLYSYTLPTSTLVADGDRLEIHYSIAGSSSTQHIWVYFGGTAFISDANYSTANPIDLVITLSRVSSSVLRWSSNASVLAANYINGNDLTSQNFATTNIIKLSAATAVNTVTAKIGTIDYHKAP